MKTSEHFRIHCKHFQKYCQTLQRMVFGFVKPLAIIGVSLQLGIAHKKTSLGRIAMHAAYDVVKNFVRPDPSTVRALGKIQSATLHEAMGKRGALPHYLRPIWPDFTMSGVALTVKSRPGDNLMLHKAVTLAHPGDVLVVDCDGFVEAGQWGEIITMAAMQKGIAGLVTNGAVRDTRQIRELGFPVFSAGISIKGTTKAVPGKINHPVAFDGVIVNPGDVVIGDNDGLVVVPCSEAVQVLAAALAKEESEAAVMEKIRQGQTAMELLGFEAAYQRLGLSEEP
jgi:4-hydroxy-4-methyl-2-oxoglutarate aldolase